MRDFRLAKLEKNLIWQRHKHLHDAKKEGLKKKENKKRNIKKEAIEEDTAHTATRTNEENNGKKTMEDGRKKNTIIE